MLQLNEEINQWLEVTAPLIVFWSLSPKEQIAVLPILEERKYDFPEGDLITNNALEVLMNAYNACLNSILIRLMVMQAELGDENIGDLSGLIDKLLETTTNLLEEDFEIINNANCIKAFEWESLRQLSSAVQQKLEIRLVLNTGVVKNCVEYWLHL